MDFKNAMLTYRSRKNLTQAQLAEKLGIERVTLGIIERTGRCKKTTLFKFIELAKEEGIVVEYNLDKFKR